MKGGCGKSTVSTNLSAYFALKGNRTVIADYDQQGSSLDWLTRRNENLPFIQGINASKVNLSITRSWQMKTQENPDIIIKDMPSGANVLNLRSVLSKTDTLIIPVLPSTIDIHATTRFIEQLLIKGRIRSRNVKVGILANRVKKNSVAFRLLERFLSRLDIPFVAQLNESQNYHFANQNGLGIHELPRSRRVTDQDQWEILTQWIENENSF